MPEVATPASSRRSIVAPHPTTVPWLWVERASNGYLVRDAAANETWLIAHDDWLSAAAALLVEINDRLGSAGDTYEERRVLVVIEPGDRWLAANRTACPHDRVRNTSGGVAGLWACICGVEFVPVACPQAVTAAA